MKQPQFATIEMAGHTIRVEVERVSCEPAMEYGQCGALGIPSEALVGVRINIVGSVIDVIVPEISKPPFPEAAAEGGCVECGHIHSPGRRCVGYGFSVR